jgi:hypothetical protein
MNDVLIISESDQREEREQVIAASASALSARPSCLFIPVQAIITAFADRNRFIRVAACTT